MIPVQFARINGKLVRIAIPVAVPVAKPVIIIRAPKSA